MATTINNFTNDSFPNSLDSKLYFPSPTHSFFFWLYICILDLVIIIANGSVLITLALKRSLAIPSKWFVTSLCIADFSTGLLVLPLETMVFLNRQNEDLVRTHGFLMGLTLMASILSIAALTYDRFLSINRPFVYRSVTTPFRNGMFVTAIWVLALLTTLLPLVWIFSPDVQFKNHVNRIYGAVILIFIVIFCFLMLLVYSYLFHVQHRRRRQIGTLSVNQQMSQRSELKAAQQCFLVFFAFAGTWLPYGIMRLYYFAHPEKVQFMTWMILQEITVLNSAFDPFVYMLYDKALRKAMIKVLCCSLQGN